MILMDNEIEFNKQIRSLLDDDGEYIKFRYWQVESLVNQASELLEKCLAQRHIARELSARALILSHQISLEEKELELERAKSIEISHLEKDQEDYEINTLKEIKENYYVESLRLADQIHGKDPSQANARMVKAANADVKELGLKIEMLTRTKSHRDLEREKITNIYSTKFANFTARQAKSKDELGILNYQNQATAIFNLMKSDFMDAVRRIKASEKGLRQIFGYQEKLPNIDSDESLLDQYIEQVRSVKRWLIGLSHKDQATSRIVSIRDIFDDHEWKNKTNDIKAGSTLEFLFNLDEKFFDLKLVRLRGISAYIDGNINQPWFGEIWVPKIALIRHFTGVSDNVNQSDFPSCKLGRIDGIKSYRAPDVYGGSSLVNASPISNTNFESGRWRVVINVPISRRDIKYDINDIMLEICVVGQSN